MALADRLEAKALLLPVDDYVCEVSDAGRSWFASALQLDVDALGAGRRVLARRCLDWTQRRPHIAGALGAAILTRCLERGWLARLAGSRALRLTAGGERGLRALGVPV